MFLVLFVLLIFKNIFYLFFKKTMHAIISLFSFCVFVSKFTTSHFEYFFNEKPQLLCDLPARCIRRTLGRWPSCGC